MDLLSAKRLCLQSLAARTGYRCCWHCDHHIWEQNVVLLSLLCALLIESLRFRKQRDSRCADFWRKRVKGQSFPGLFGKRVRSSSWNVKPKSDMWVIELNRSGFTFKELRMLLSTWLWFNELCNIFVNFFFFGHRLVELKNHSWWAYDDLVWSQAGN